MPESYYCSKCGTEYPPTPDNEHCDACGQHTFPRYAPIPGRQDPVGVVEQGTVGTQTTSAATAHEHRVERYLDLGFSEAQAQLLATTRVQEKDSKGRTCFLFLYHGRVAELLQRGCSHDLVVSILV